MRELRLCEPQRDRKPSVSWLEFGPTGGELVARVNDDLLACDLRTDAVGPLFGSDDPHAILAGDYCALLALAPDRPLLAIAAYTEPSQFVIFVEPLGRDHSLTLPSDDTARYGALAFTPDGKELVVVRDHWAADGRTDVARLSLAPLLAPKRFIEKKNPLNGAAYKAPATPPKWRPVMDLPLRDACSVALSANGKLVAVGTDTGAVCVADLKKKAVVASFPGAGTTPYYAAARVAFDPTAKWVVWRSAARLTARPLGVGEAWHTPEALGAINDFAFHPGGRVLCAACADGQARFLDPLTGAVQKSFKWSKKPKPLCSVAFARDGLTCAVGTADGKVIVWDVDV